MFELFMINIRIFCSNNSNFVIYDKWIIVFCIIIESMNWIWFKFVDWLHYFNKHARNDVNNRINLCFWRPVCHVKFNISEFNYLIYATIWVSFYSFPTSIHYEPMDSRGKKAPAVVLIKTTVITNKLGRVRCIRKDKDEQTVLRPV